MEVFVSVSGVLQAWNVCTDVNVLVFHGTQSHAVLGAHLPTYCRFKRMTGLVDLPAALERIVFPVRSGEPAAKRVRASTVRIVAMCDHEPGRFDRSKMVAHVYVFPGSKAVEEEIVVLPRQLDYTNSELGAWALEMLGGKARLADECLKVAPDCKLLEVKAAACRPPIGVLVELHSAQSGVNLADQERNAIVGFIEQNSQDTTLAAFLLAKGDVRVPPDVETLTLHRGGKSAKAVGPIPYPLFFTDSKRVAERYGGEFGADKYLMTANVSRALRVLDISDAVYPLLKALGGYNSGDLLGKLCVTGIDNDLVARGFDAVVLCTQSMAEIILFRGEIASCDRVQ